MPSAGVMLPKADSESLTWTMAALPGCRIIALLPSADEIQWAERVVAAFAASAGGAASVDGKMIDKPVVERARRMIAEFTGASLA